MATTNFILLSVVSILIIAESIFDRLHDRDLYNGRETMVNLFIFTIGIVLNLTMRGFFLGIYYLVHQYALFPIGGQWWAWILIVLLCDFNQYSLHFLEHRVRFLWAIHVVHHSATKMNLTTAIRLPVLNMFFRLFVHVPLAFIGFPPTMILLADGLIYLYSFLLHTEVIRSLGFLEWIFNTPSHHRVHHASNPQYIDKNYGGFLIIWDRLFGTFEIENEKCRYGLTKPINTYNPLKVIFHEWYELIHDSLYARDTSTAVKHFIMPPEWKPGTDSLQKKASEVPVELFPLRDLN